MGQCLPGENPFVMVNPSVLSAPSPGELLSLFSAAESARYAERGITFEGVASNPPSTFYGPEVIAVFTSTTIFDGEPESYDYSVYTVCTVVETPTPAPETFNWQNQGHLLQALLIVMAVVIFTMGYRAGDKT